jgi:hypothetical protein
VITDIPYKIMMAEDSALFNADKSSLGGRAHVSRRLFSGHHTLHAFEDGRFYLSLFWNCSAQ